MKLLLKLLVPLMIVAAITGCEWSSGGGSSWSGSPAWVNFSGVYRGANGGVLVTDYTATPGTPGVTNTVTRTIGVGNGGGVYGGLSLGYDNIVIGSVVIDAAGYQFTDDGSGVLNGNLAGTGGTINHGTGIVNIDLGNLTIDAGEPIVATFKYAVAGTQGSGSAGPGTSGIVIYTFTVFQEGNKLEITDNNGSVYKGKFGDVSTTSGGSGSTVDEEGNEVFEAGSSAVAQYSVEGVSAAGMNVRMVGTMQGVLATAGGVFADRIMIGTWIEDGGRTGDINGQASPIAVTDTTTTTP